MVGRVVAKVTFFEPTFWRFDFDQESHFSVECLWRIIKSWRVAVTGKDHAQQFGLPAPVDAVALAASLLSGIAITAVEVREATADVFIDFACDLRLEVIPDSSGYESRHTRGPGGVCLVAQGGGQICTWTEGT